MLTGKAIGAKDRNAFTRNLRDSSRLAAVTAVALSLLVFVFGHEAISFLTIDESVRDVATQYLPYAAFYILISFVSFQLYGVFIGANLSKEMRNASLISVLLFIGIGLVLVTLKGNQGLWLAFSVYVLVRGISLLSHMQ